MSTPEAIVQPAATDAFEFVQALATELSRGSLDLPGFPEIVVRVRRVLADENVAAEKVARVIAAEPVLAAQLLQTANSVALNPSGTRVNDVRAAILRVGLNGVRSTTLAFAVRQLRGSASLRGLDRQLDALWQRSVLTASICFVVARRLTRLNPDAALLAGLLQGIGRLYILTRASLHRALFADVASYQAIERDWHLSITVAILEHWGLDQELVQAVHDCEDFAREPRGAVCMTDVLTAATLIATCQEQPELLEARLQNVRAIARLNLDRATCQSLLEESAEEIAALRAALG
jgi:HD-like signal output (HDOD) protein